MPENNIVSLIEKCRINDHKAQNKLYDLYFNAMFNVAFRILHDKYLAEDVVQEAFIIVFTKNNLSNNITFSKWLKRIVINKSINLFKKESKFSLLEKETEKIIEQETFTIDKDIGKSVRRVLKEIQELKDNYRILLLLHYIEGYDIDELVEITGYTATNCRTIISRGLKQLRKRLNYEKRDK